MLFCVSFGYHPLNHLERIKSANDLKLSDNLLFCDALKAFSEPYVNRTSWFEARDYCLAIGGDLLSMHSVTDLKALQSRTDTDILYKKFWIGLRSPDPDTGYVWSDGSPVSKLSTLIELFKVYWT